MATGGPPAFGIFYADQYGSLQAAVNAAGANGAVFIPPTYPGADSYANPLGITVLDLRPGKLALNAATGAAQVQAPRWPYWAQPNPAGSAAAPQTTFAVGQPAGPLAAITSPGPQSK